MLNTALPHTCDVDFGTKVRPVSAQSTSTDVSGSGAQGGGSSDNSPSPSSPITSSGSSSASDSSELRFVMTCVRSVPSGAQVHDSYGLKSNDRFLMSYGFSLEDNVR